MGNQALKHTEAGLELDRPELELSLLVWRPCDEVGRSSAAGGGGGRFSFLSDGAGPASIAA